MTNPATDPTNPAQQAPTTTNRTSNGMSAKDDRMVLMERSMGPACGPDRPSPR